MVPSIFKHWNMRGMWKGSDAANPGKYTVISGLTFEYINITNTHMRHTIQKVVSFYPRSQYHYLEVDMRMPCINVVVVSWRSKSPLGRLHPTPGDPSHILQRGEGAPRDPNWKSCSVTAVGSLGDLARSCILPVHLHGIHQCDDCVTTPFKTPLSDEWAWTPSSWPYKGAANNTEISDQS